MLLSDQDIREVQQMALDECGRKIAKQEAFDLAERHLAAFRAIYRPIPTKTYVRTSKEDNL